MNRTSMTLAALLVAVSAERIYEFGKEKAPIQIVPEVPVGAVELKTADAALILKKLAAGSAVGKVVCSTSGASNHPGRCYCHDGGVYGGFVDVAECPDEVIVIAGKVFVADKAIAEAVK